MTATQTPGGDHGDDWKWPLCKHQALGSSGNLLDVKSDFEAFLSIQLETVEDIYREFYNQVFDDGSNCTQLRQWDTTLILNTTDPQYLNTEDVIVIWLWTGGLRNGVREVASADHE